MKSIFNGKRVMVQCLFCKTTETLIVRVKIIFYIYAYNLISLWEKETKDQSAVKYTLAVQA